MPCRDCANWIIQIHPSKSRSKMMAFFIKVEWYAIHFPLHNYSLHFCSSGGLISSSLVSSLQPHPFYMLMSEYFCAFHTCLVSLLALHHFWDKKGIPYYDIQGLTQPTSNVTFILSFHLFYDLATKDYMKFSEHSLKFSLCFFKLNPLPHLPFSCSCLVDNFL